MGDLARALLPMRPSACSRSSLRFGAESRLGFADGARCATIALSGRRSPARGAPGSGGDPRAALRGEPVPAAATAAPAPRPSATPRPGLAPPGRRAAAGRATIPACGRRTRPSRRCVPAARASPPSSAPGTGSASSAGRSATSLLGGSGPSLVAGGPRRRAGAPGPGGPCTQRFGHCHPAQPRRLRTTSRAPGGDLPDARRAPQVGACDRLAMRTCACATSRSTRCPAAGLAGVPGALDDLRDALLRVLHDASFADDPTRRPVRALRGAPRLRRRPTRARRRGRPGDRERGPPRRRAARAAEPDPFAALRAAADLHPGLLPPGSPCREDAGRARPAAPGPRAPCRLLASGAAGSTRRRSWPGSTTSASPRPTAASSAPPRGPSRRPLRAARTPSAIARAARGAPVEAVGAGRRRGRPPLARGPAPRPLLSITDDLLAVASARPRGRERLQRALDAKLDGRAPRAAPSCGPRSTAAARPTSLTAMSVVADPVVPAPSRASPSTSPTGTAALHHPSRRGLDRPLRDAQPRALDRRRPRRRRREPPPPRWPAADLQGHQVHGTQRGRSRAARARTPTARPPPTPGRARRADALSRSSPGARSRWSTPVGRAVRRRPARLLKPRAGPR